VTASAVCLAANRYRELITDLVVASRRHDATLAAANQSYTDGVAAVEHDLIAAQDAATAAVARSAQAHRAVAQTDLVAAGLWDELRKVRGRQGRRLGQVPSPLPPADPDADPDADAIALLDSVAARVDRARRGGEPLPTVVLPVLLVLGSACAAVLGLAGGWLLGRGTSGTILGWLMLACAPLAGLPIARRWVDYRFLARLDAGATGLLVLGGMLATVALTLTLR
jgi:hypothetical protein